MKFYPGSSDEEAETPYGVVMARDLEAPVPGDPVYYGTLQVRIVHDIDDAESDEHDRRLRETMLALVNLTCPVADPEHGVRLLGMTPQQVQSVPGKNVFVDILPVTCGLEDLTPEDAITSTPQRRIEKALAAHLEAHTGTG